MLFDVRSAYYSVLRDLLTSTQPQGEDIDYAWARARLLFHNVELQARFVSEFRKGNMLEALGASPATVAFFQAHLRCTWYVTRPDTHTAFRAESGTAPGSPVADVLFALLFRGFLEHLQQELRNTGICAHALAG